MATLKSTVIGSDLTLASTIRNDTVKFHSYLLDDDSGKFDRDGGDPAEKRTFQSTGGLDQMVSITANSVGSDGYVDDHALLYLTRDDSGNLDLFSSKSSGGGTSIEHNNILGAGDFLANGGIELEMLHNTVDGKDGLIATTAMIRGVTVVQFTSLFLDDETGAYNPRFSDTGTNRTAFRDQNVDKVVALDAASVGSNGFNKDAAYMLLVETTADEFDLYTVAQSGREVTLEASDVLDATFTNRNGTFDVVEGSTKMAFISDTATGNDGLIVQLGEDANTGQGQWQFTKIFNDDETGEFAFIGDSVALERALDVNGNRIRPDVEAILALEAAPVGEDGFNPAQAYLMTVRDEAGNIDIYGVDQGGRLVTLIDDNVDAF
jgi:hypothetical protein